MLASADLLRPIEGKNPVGTNVRYDPVYDRIKQARRDDPLHDPPIKADWGEVENLAAEVLGERSKDLWVAAWLCEALLQRHGIAGLAAGLELVQRLLETYWADIHPQAEDGDLELRAAPLAWIGEYLDVPVRLSSLNAHRHHYVGYRESQAVPTEEEAESDKQKRSRRDAAIADGKLEPESFEAGFVATPRAWYEELVAAIDTAIERAANLETFCDERFGEAAPGFRKLRGALEELRRAAGTLLDRKAASESGGVELGDVVAATGSEEATVEAAIPPSDSVRATEAEGPAETENAGAAPGEAAPSVARARSTEPRPQPPQPTSRDDAAARIAAAARYLRAETATDPAPYLLLRGFRWGELRANAGALEPRLLEAPPTELRARLKGHLLDGSWADLLEAAEDVMATPFGRGWLDLQRYVVTALEALGPDYAPAADAVRSALRSLLDDLPGLVDASLMDDSATANRETLAWLRAHGVLRADHGAEDEAAVEPAAPAEPPPTSADQILKRLGTSDPQRAIDILMRNAERERSERAGFLRRADAARIMVECGHERVALPILRRMLEQIEQHRLEEWEASQTVAGALGLLYRCMDRLGVDSKEQDALYLRVCRLDPLQAIAVPRGDGAATEKVEA